ncbi:hypothetical protein Aperf_G00000085176 [Anoplocephala perfoliata]
MRLLTDFKSLTLLMLCTLAFAWPGKRQHVYDDFHDFAPYSQFNTGDMDEISPEDVQRTEHMSDRESYNGEEKDLSRDYGDEKYLYPDSQLRLEEEQPYGYEEMRPTYKREWPQPKEEEEPCSQQSPDECPCAMCECPCWEEQPCCEDEINLDGDRDKESTQSKEESDLQCPLTQPPCECQCAVCLCPCWIECPCWDDEMKPTGDQERPHSEGEHDSQYQNEQSPGECPCADCQCPCWEDKPCCEDEIKPRGEQDHEGPQSKEEHPCEQSLEECPCAICHCPCCDDQQCWEDEIESNEVHEGHQSKEDHYSHQSNGQSYSDYQSLYRERQPQYSYDYFKVPPQRKRIPFGYAEQVPFQYPYIPF